MTLYARGDLGATNGVPGGCGETHSRPVIAGAPQKVWTLDCLECENWLRVNMPDQWSVTLAELPETYDQTKVRERDEKMGKMDREQQLAEALIHLGALPSALGQAIASALAGGNPAAALPVAGLLECPVGHAQPPGVKFCGECGSPMSAPEAAPSLPAAEPAAAKSAPRMRDGRVEVLQAFARANGLDDSGGRKDLIPRLSAAGLTGKWSGFAATYQPETAAA